LKNHRPRNEGKKEQDRKDDAGDQSGLRENAHNVGRKNSIEEKNDVPLSERELFFLGLKTVAHAPNTRNPFDAEVSGCAAYQETGVRAGEQVLVAFLLSWESMIVC
jgi:hypothetical protein